MMSDIKALRGDRGAPVSGGFPITPSDANDLSEVARVLWIGTGGDLKVDLVDGSTLTFTNVQGGWWEGTVKKVYATGTTASGIIGCR